MSSSKDTSHRGNNNALTHGGTSQKLFLPTENPADFEALLAGIRAEYTPETEQHHLFVEQLAMAHWLLWRRQRAYNSIEAAVYHEAGNDPANLTEAQFHRLALAERYKIAAERALKRAFANAESIPKGRKSDRDYRERHARWQAAQELRDRRLRITEARHEAAERREKDEMERQRAIQSLLLLPQSFRKQPPAAELLPNRKR